MWKNEQELLQLIEQELYSPVVRDILDGLGKYHQFLPQPIRPTKDCIEVLVERCLPL